MTDSVSWGQLKQTADDAVRPLDPATYQFLCTKSEPRRASTGAHMIVVHLVVQGGPKHGKDLMHNFVFSPDNSFALALWFRNFEAFGIGADMFAQLSGNLDQDMATLAQLLLGRQVMGTVSIRKFQGQDRNQFDAFSPVVGQPGVAGPSVVNGPGALVGAGIPTPQVATGPVVPPVPTIPQGPGPQVQTVPSVPSVPTTYEQATGVPQSTPVGGPPLPPEEPF